MSYQIALQFEDGLTRMIDCAPGEKLEFRIANPPQGRASHRHARQRRAARAACGAVQPLPGEGRLRPPLARYARAKAAHPRLRPPPPRAGAGGVEPPRREGGGSHGGLSVS